ncbi:MAG: histidinol-phosphatase HisJ family protein [Clostridia bacterium]|nr:histidinol-phosphatase HisJ family protein [Clostridia bacterium]
MLYDMHLHSNLSHDAKSTPKKMCETAIKNGLSGIAFSDHCDPHITPLNKMLEDAKRNHRVYDDMKKEYGDSLLVMSSIEIGDAHDFFEGTQQVAAALPYDSVIGSVHVMKDAFGKHTPHTQIDFSGFSQDAIDEYLTAYFNALEFIAKKADFDILAHLNLPIRYINGKYNMSVNIEKYMPQIKRILSVIIDREIALEINTSEIGKTLNDTLPSMDIAALYKSMGGSLITLGSDAHVADTLGNGLKEARDMLLQNGITQACYFKDRNPIFYAL